MAENNERLSSLESRVTKLEVNSAVSEERHITILKRFDKLDNEVGEIRGYFRRIVWIVGGSIIAAFMTFALGGGLVG